MSRPIDIEELTRKVGEAVAKVPPRAVLVNPATVREFCEIVGESDPVYWDREEARRRGIERVPLPYSYLLTLIAPLSQDLFIVGLGEVLGPFVRGVIHSSSVIEIYSPLYCETPYELALGFSGLVKKTGTMGEYLVGTFPHRVFDGQGGLVAEDSHVFFLRTDQGT